MTIVTFTLMSYIKHLNNGYIIIIMQTSRLGYSVSSTFSRYPNRLLTTADLSITVQQVHLTTVKYREIT